MQSIKSKKRFVALLLVCMMVFTSLSTLALADGPYTITIKNQQTNTSGPMLGGAIYEIKQVKGAYDPVAQEYKAPGTYTTKQVTIPVLAR